MFEPWNNHYYCNEIFKINNTHIYLLLKKNRFILTNYFYYLYKIVPKKNNFWKIIIISSVKWKNFNKITTGIFAFCVIMNLILFSDANRYSHRIRIGRCRWCENASLLHVRSQCNDCQQIRIKQRTIKNKYQSYDLQVSSRYDSLHVIW